MVYVLLAEVNQTTKETVGYVDIWLILEVLMIMTMMILMMNTCLEEAHFQVIIMLICPICGYPLDSDGRCWNCGYWMRTHPLDPFAPGSVYNGGNSDD